MENEYTTAQVAKACRVGKMFLLRLVWSAKLPEVRTVHVGGMKVRLWSNQDLIRAAELVKELKEKKKNRRST